MQQVSQASIRQYSQVRHSAVRSILSVFAVGALVHGSLFAQVPSGSGTLVPAKTLLPLYGTWEITLSRNLDAIKNPFDMEEVAINVEVSGPNGQRFKALGFFDGQSEASTKGIWRARIMPTKPGRWCAILTWNVTSPPETTRCIDVAAHAPPGNHGHVTVDPNHPERLVYDDGTIHYWIGGKWFGARGDYAPCQKYPYNKRKCYTDAQILEYLNLLHEFSHNGILIKLALFPLLDDGISWNLDLIRRAEWLVREAGSRGIYVQLNLFDTWSRRAGGQLEVTTDGSDQILNAWDESRLAEKRNYLRTAVSRFAGFFNVYWELGNEMEHLPNCGECFANLANRFYLPWIRATDPYGLPIGLSERVWTHTNVDIGFLHQTNELPDITWRKPTIMNELVRGGTPPSPSHLWSKGIWQFLKQFWNDPQTSLGLYSDHAIRDPWYRYDYRRTFWQVFTSGGSGSSEATWLDLTTPLNSAVLQVMADHRSLASFRRVLPTNLQPITPISGPLALDGIPGTMTALGSDDQLYLVYIAAGHSTYIRASTASLRLPSGTYFAQWIEPHSLRVLQQSSFVQESVSATTNVHYPAFHEDLLLLLTKDRPISLISSSRKRK